MRITNPQDIQINSYNYELPDDRIAKYPLDERDQSKLLIYNSKEIKDSHFYQLSDYIPANSLMVFNNTKVIQARLHFQKTTGASIEVFCLEPYLPKDYAQNFQQHQKCSWHCLIGNLKKWKEGKLSKTIIVDNQKIVLHAERIESLSNSHIIQFTWDNDHISFSELLEAIGELPIPPYLNRQTEEKDLSSYQTVYSKIKGSVAAPTAGLHFTEKVLNSLKGKGIKTEEVTLHVGAGTFRPVKSEKIGGHEMHSEFISVNKDTIIHVLENLGRNKVIAVGTTSVRTLESLYYIGELLEDSSCTNLNVSQWQPYNSGNNKLSAQKALTNIINYLDKNDLNSIMANTQIIIAPGYEFKIVDGIITNFHQPQSTLLLLVSAFVSDNQWLNIYKHALNHEYRFLSYGDSSLLLKE